jgi:hypothetical protein
MPPHTQPYVLILIVMVGSSIAATATTTTTTTICHVGHSCASWTASVGTDASIWAVTPLW